MKDQTGKQLREAFQTLLGIMYEDSAKLRVAAEKLGIPFETARQARDYGKGSVITINGLILHGLGIQPQDLHQHLPKLRKMFSEVGELTVLEKLIEQILAKYGRNKLVAWLRLLLARDEIERELGLVKSAGRPRKKK